MKTSVVIIGGGASGAFSAMHLSQNIDAIVIDNVPIAKKLLVTGNGRCNLTNTALEGAYNVRLERFFERFGREDTLDFFESIGLLTYADDEGRVYPISNSAVSVQEVIQQRIQTSRRVCFVRDKVTAVKCARGGYLVETASGEPIECEYVVVACGGNAVVDLPDGVEVTPFVPALCGLTTPPNDGLNGVRVQNVAVTLRSGEREVYSERGEILFKKDGISGIVIMNISCHLDGLTAPNLVLDLLPDIDEDRLAEFVTRTIANNDLMVSQVLNGILHISLASHILSQCGVDFGANAKTLSTQKITAIAHKIKHYTLDITGRATNNQIYMGGVSLEALTDDLEHKRHAGLFVTGEYTEVAGHCGGYNLQWAFTSGAIVGRAISERMK